MATPEEIAKVAAEAATQTAILLIKKDIEWLKWLVGIMIGVVVGSNILTHYGI